MKKVIRLKENDIEKLVKRIIKENREIDNMDDHDANTYMFWQNLETMKESIEHILEMDKNGVNQILTDGHGWALDHIATSTDDVEEVYHFLKSHHGEMGEGYNESEFFKGKLIESDDFGSVELLVEGSKACENKGLSKPWYTPDGPKKRSVCVKKENGNVVKVNFGDPNMRIRKSNPERRKSFRARHKCDNPGPKWKAKYWSCKFW